MKWKRSGIEILRSRRSLAVVAGMEKPRMTTQNRQKSNAKKINKKKHNLERTPQRFTYKTVQIYTAIRGNRTDIVRQNGYLSPIMT